MEATTPPRVQLVISGKFIALFLISLALLGGGYFWYSRQQKSRLLQEEFDHRFIAPAYFVNKRASILRPCEKCLSSGKLKPHTEWNVGQAKEIPTSEQRWFLAVEEQPAPVEVFGVLMLPVHPALRDNPAFGFDRGKVQLVIYHDLQRKRNIEQPPPPLSPPPAPVLPTAPPASGDPVTGTPVQPPEIPKVLPTPPATGGTPEPSAKTENGVQLSSTVVMKSSGNWQVTLAHGADWFYTGIPIVPAERLVIRPEHSANGETRWSGKVGTRALIDSTPKDFTLVVPFRPWFLPPHRWLAILYLRLDQASEPLETLDVEITYAKLPDIFDPLAQPTPLTRELLDELKHSRTLAEQLETAQQRTRQQGKN
jgi:hypothetical protein